MVGNGQLPTNVIFMTKWRADYSRLRSRYPRRRCIARWSRHGAFDAMILKADTATRVLLSVASLSRGSRTHPWLYAAVPPGLAMRNRDAHPRVAIQLCGDLLFHRDYLFRAGLIVRSVAHLDCNHMLAGADIYYEVELL